MDKPYVNEDIKGSVGGIGIMLRRGKTHLLVDDELYAAVADLISNAEDTLDLVSPWIGDLGQLLDRIKDCILDGVEVRVFTREPAGEDRPHQRAVEELKRARARIIFDERLHAKMVLCDREVLLCMSANLTRSSMTDKHEAGILTEDKDAVRKASSYLDRLAYQATERQVSELASKILEVFRGQRTILREIARKVGKTKQDVLRALELLEDKGEVHVEKRRAKAGHRYRLYIFEG